MGRLLALVLVLVAACAGAGALAPPTSPPPPLPLVELKYRVFDEIGRPWYCDPDFYPIARADEKELARQRLPEMQKDADVWPAILAHNSLGAGANLTDDQFLTAYHDWKDLRALELQPQGLSGAFVPPSAAAGVYSFLLTVRPASNTKQAERVEGRVSTAGKIDVVSRQTAGPPNCPICLVESTTIDTPSGPRRVTELRVGDVVWTQGAGGERLAAPLVATGSTDAAPGHEVLRIVLADGRTVTASPGHPAVDGRTLATFGVGEAMDGSAIASIERLPYSGRTYDLLPAGASGAYWADGVLLGSTLRQ